MKHLVSFIVLFFSLMLCLVASMSFVSCSDNGGGDGPSQPPQIGEIEDPTDNPKYPKAQPVDMGLSVCWASWNMGEESEFGTNRLFGWGDIGNGGSSLDDFPCPFPPENISGSEYDVATHRWGKEWRLPLDNEFSELWNNSHVSIGEYNGTTYYKFTSKLNENVIYLPLGNYFYKACYWTSELYISDTRKAKARFFDYEASTPEFGWVNLERDNKALVRPVYEQSKAVTKEAKNVTGKSATLCGTLSWLASERAEEAGFYISGTLSDIETPSPRISKVEATIDKKTISAQIDELTRNTTYYFRAYVVIDGEEYLGEIKNFSSLNAYEVGDLYPNENNPIGVVFVVNTSGESGRIVSLDQTTLQWQPGIATYVNANNRDDGSNNEFPVNSPIPSWIQDHGDGWYCPAKNELHTLCGAAKDVNVTLRRLGRKVIENFYWASTQYSAEYYDLAWIVNVTENDTYMGYRQGYSTYNSKTQERGVLAVKKFGNNTN